MEYIEQQLVFSYEEFSKNLLKCKKLTCEMM